MYEPLCSQDIDALTFAVAVSQVSSLLDKNEWQHTGSVIQSVLGYNATHIKKKKNHLCMSDAHRTITVWYIL